MSRLDESDLATSLVLSAVAQPTGGAEDELGSRVLNVSRIRAFSPSLPFLDDRGPELPHRGGAAAAAGDSDQGQAIVSATVDKVDGGQQVSTAHAGLGQLPPAVTGGRQGHVAAGQAAVAAAIGSSLAAVAEEDGVPATPVVSHADAASAVLRQRLKAKAVPPPTAVAAAQRPAAGRDPSVKITASGRLSVATAPFSPEVQAQLDAEAAARDAAAREAAQGAKRARFDRESSVQATLGFKRAGK